MDAKEFLSQAFCLEQRIQSKLEQIASLRSLATQVRQAFGSEPVSHTRNVTAMQDTVGKILEAEEELNQQIDELVEIKLEIGRVIERVENIQLRLILEKRYLSYQTWDTIAEDLGYSPRWMQVKQQEALGVVQKILDWCENAG